MCAAQCLLNITNYGACYNACVSNQPSVVQVPGSGSANPVTPIQGNKNPVVTPGTNNNATSGPATTSSTSTANQTYPGSSATTPQAQAFANVNWQDVGIRAGLVIGGSILVIVGIIRIFGAEKVVGQMNQTALPRKPQSPPQPIVNRRTFVETRQVSNPPTVNKRPNVAAAAAGEP